MIRDLARIYGARLLCLQADGWAATDLIGEIASIKPGFDCFIVNRAKGFDSANSVLVEAIVSRAGEWIEVFGDAAEEIHDAIDAASVRIGRQSTIGEGDPMTTWHDNLSDSEIASYVWTGGQGASDTKVVVIVGMPPSATNVTRALLEHRQAVSAS